MSARIYPADQGVVQNAKAVILYDQLETMLIVNQQLATVPPRAGGSRQWIVNSWRFEMLRHGSEVRRALQDTADVELMIVAIGSTTALRAWPTDWLACWAAQRRDTPMLAVCLVGAAITAEAPGEIILPLHQLAERHHLEFRIMNGAPTEVNRSDAPNLGPAGSRPGVPFELSGTGRTAPGECTALGKLLTSVSRPLNWIPERAA